jgi:iron(III) transport system ATP-binding protein
MLKLEIDGVTKSFGSFRALENLSLRVEDGEVVVLLGPSGCGKTTLLRTIGGFIQPDEGTVRINGQVVASAAVMVPPERRLLSMVFQSYAVWPHKTVFENLAYGLRLKRMPQAAMREKIAQGLELVRMVGYADRYPAELSGGQQQRVALARALVLEPQLLLFDEPLSNLDAGLREQMRFEIKAMLKQLGITGIYVTHDQNEAMVVGDRIAVMERGRIEQIGTAEEIYYDSQTEFVAGFVGLANVLNAEVIGPAADGLVRVRVNGIGEMVSRASSGSPLRGAARLFIRPESISFGNGPSDSNTLHGQVRRRTFMGASTDFLVDVGGVQLRVVSPSDAPDQPTSGEAILNLRPDRCLVLAA